MSRRLFMPLAFAALLASSSGSVVFAQDNEGSEMVWPACAAAASTATPVATRADVEVPAWQSIELTNARTGDVFSIADFAGCTVLVETMATWCPSCKKQLANVAEARKELNPETTVFIAVSVETDLKPEDLAKYADDNEFDWIFAVASVDMLKAIEEAFGRNAIVPPSTPHVVIQPDGQHSDLFTGVSSPEEIVDLVSDEPADA